MHRDRHQSARTRHPSRAVPWPVPGSWGAERIGPLPEVPASFRCRPSKTGDSRSRTTSCRAARSVGSGSATGCARYRWARLARPGALGFWSAVREGFPETREQRCWWHKIGNALNALPKSTQPGAKKALADICNAEDKDHAQAAANVFAADYGTKWPWRSSSSNQHRPGGGPSTHPTSSRWSVPAIQERR
jgi:hypothetical protein